MGNFSELAGILGPAGSAPEAARDYAAWLDCLADMAYVLTPASAYRERNLSARAGQSLTACSQPAKPAGCGGHQMASTI